jgi:hypothetical protein
MSLFIDARDRLLLAFANLASYGIHAHPAVSGSLDEARDTVTAEAASRVPFAPSDYVFWREADEPLAFDRTGSLIGTLPLHCGNRSIVPAVREALSSARFASRNAADGQNDEVLVVPFPPSQRPNAPTLQAEATAT